jgi:hypothetical protein
MSKRTFGFAMFLLACALCFSERPYWWDNPHEDDEFDMYERGKCSAAATEEEALKKAVVSAKEMLVERIGITPALKSVGLQSSPDYAIVNFTVADSGTEKNGKSWTAWVLIKYPQAEKKIILDRWNASIASINELKKQEGTIPVQFGLKLRTGEGKSAYRDGETVSFAVDSDTDCYLVLVDHQSDGTTVLLFPNRFHRECLVKKGETVIIPNPSDGAFKLVVGAPFGDDRVEAIASTSESSLHRTLADLVVSLPETQNMAVLSRGIFVQSLANATAAPVKTGTTESKGVRWSRAELNLSTFVK